MLRRFEQFTSAISQIYKSVQKIKKTEMTRFGLKANHVMLVYHLKAHPEGLTPAELCKCCNVDKAAISRAVSELTANGYIQVIQREGKHYRLPVILTDNGREAANHIERAVNNAVSIGGQGLTDLQRLEFYHALLLIADNLENYQEVSD